MSSRGEMKMSLKLIIWAVLEFSRDDWQLNCPHSRV